MVEIIRARAGLCQAETGLVQSEYGMRPKDARTRLLLLARHRRRAQLFLSKLDSQSIGCLDFALAEPGARSHNSYLRFFFVS